MERLLWICFGGAIGTGARYLVGLWAQRQFGGALPWGTFLVNVAGAFLIAFIGQSALEIGDFPPTLRLALTTGFLGGLTTWSALAWETTALARNGMPGTALAYFAATTLASLLLALLGIALATLLFRG